MQLAEVSAQMRNSEIEQIEGRLIQKTMKLEQLHKLTLKDLEDCLVDQQPSSISSKPAHATT